MGVGLGGFFLEWDGVGWVSAQYPDSRGGGGQWGGGQGRERGRISCLDHRGGAGSGIITTCAGRVRVTHDPLPTRPVAIPTSAELMTHDTRTNRRPMAQGPTEVDLSFLFIF